MANLQFNQTFSQPYEPLSPHVPIPAKRRTHIQMTCGKTVIAMWLNGDVLQSLMINHLWETIIPPHCHMLSLDSTIHPSWSSWPKESNWQSLCQSGISKTEPCSIGNLPCHQPKSHRQWILCPSLQLTKSRTSHSNKNIQIKYENMIIWFLYRYVIHFFVSWLSKL